MYNKEHKQMRIVAFLPKARRETRGCAAVLPACAEISI
jgi:hypothetical protein